MPRWAILGLAALAFAGLAAAQDNEILARGHKLYRIHCQNCHGESGRGDGPMAELLKVAPADLTRLAHDAGGELPASEVYRIIDGREEVRGHGAVEMPVWGLTFQDRGLDADQGDLVRGRILELIAYLRTIQTTLGADD